MSWTGLQFTWDDRSGDTVVRRQEAISGPFKRFVDNLSHWRYSLDECRVNHHDLRDFLSTVEGVYDFFEPAAFVRSICASRYNNPLVFSVQIGVEQPGRGHATSASNVLPLAGPIYFLPESQLSEEEALEFVLRDLCGVDVSAPEPEWVSEFVAPGQEEVDREIAELDDQLQGLIKKYDRKTQNRDEIREPLRLLYETGTALEEAVCSILEELGAQIERPEERNKEDGWIAVRVGDEMLEGVLEVKGVNKPHFNTYGLRQLSEWIERGITFRKKKYTGLFVGNSSIKDPPRARPWPFNRNWIEDAELRGFAAIRSEDLYILYLLDRTDRLDRDGLWRALFSTKGPFDMGPYRKKLTDEEKEQLENLPQE